VPQREQQKLTAAGVVTCLALAWRQPNRAPEKQTFFADPFTHSTVKRRETQKSESGFSFFVVSRRADVIAERREVASHSSLYSCSSGMISSTSTAMA
jgi:hypothetical protein